MTRPDIATDAGRGSPTTLKSIGSKEPEEEEETKAASVVSTTGTNITQTIPAPKQYERRKWVWDEAIQDYVSEHDGHKIQYTRYQKSGGNPSQSLSLHVRSPTTTAKPLPGAKLDTKPSTDENGEPNDSPQHMFSGGNRDPPPPPPPPSGPPKKPWESPLDIRFGVVEKPKRFFTPGRIFKTIWYEPWETGMPARQSDHEWAEKRPAFYGSRPLAKFRWFVVVRKRLNHSLCFSITTATTAGDTDAMKTRRGRAVDFVVLYSSDIKPPAPLENEGVIREPISVIIEEVEQYISPLARLDCSRIYTVEDSLKVMKIGRVHPESLPLLNDYFVESVA
ncbi:hypothetical protein OQA88_4524 [Cercophora sp. LCS_1]